MNYDVIDLEVAEESATNSYDELVAMEARIKDRTVAWYENKEVFETKITTFIKEANKQYKAKDYAQATDSLDQAKKACDDLSKHVSELTMEDYCRMTKSGIERPKALERYKKTIHSEIQSKISDIDKLIKKVAKKVEKQGKTESAMASAMMAYLATFGLNEDGEEIDSEAFDNAMESVLSSRSSFRDAIDDFDNDLGEYENLPSVAFEGLTFDEVALGRTILDLDMSDEDIDLYLAEEGVLKDAANKVKKAVKETKEMNKARNNALRDDAKTVTSSKRAVKKELSKSKVLSRKDLIATSARIAALIAALKAVEKSKNIESLDAAIRDEIRWFENFDNSLLDKPVEYSAELIGGDDGPSTTWGQNTIIEKLKRQYDECEKLVTEVNVKMRTPEGSEYYRSDRNNAVPKMLFKDLVIEIPEKVNAAYRACGLAFGTLMSGKLKVGVSYRVKDYLTAVSAYNSLTRTCDKAIKKLEATKEAGKDVTAAAKATKDIVEQLENLGTKLEKDKGIEYARSKFSSLCVKAKSDAEDYKKRLNELSKSSSDTKKKEDVGNESWLGECPQYR